MMMRTYCAFLRGVNIGGQVMKMAEACDALKSAGLTGVGSVLATGNLVFQSDKPQKELRRFLEQTLAKAGSACNPNSLPASDNLISVDDNAFQGTNHYDDNVSLFVKNLDEVKSILSSMPFCENTDLHIYTFICEKGFEKTLLDEFGKITPADEEAAKISNGLFYWQCRKGATLDSGFSKILGRKNMKDKFTSRNISTIAKVAAKMEATRPKNANICSQKC